MNRSIFSLLLVGLFGCQQNKTEILLLGVYHQIPDSLACNWKFAYDQVMKFNPDQIAIEYLPPSDTASMPFFLGEDYKAKWDSLMLAWEGRSVSTADSIRFYQDKVKHSQDWQLRYPLWKYYQLGLDIGNRDFQTYLLYKQIVKTGEYPDTSTVFGRAFWSRCRATVTARKAGEFFNLVFPIAEELGIPYLYPTDDKVTFPAQSEAWSRFNDAFASKPEWQRIDSFWRDYVRTDSLQLANCNGMAFINTTYWVDKTDIGQTKLAADWNSPAYQDYVAVWYKRNKSIADRIIAAAKQSASKRMVVFYGNMHVYPVRKYLEEQGYTVKLLADVKP